MLFWTAAIIFFGTYLLIASEKVNKTTAALMGASLMLIFVLEGPGHLPASFKDYTQGQQYQKADGAPTISHTIEKGLIARNEKYEKLDIYSRYVNFDVIFTLAGMMILVNILSKTGLFQFVAIKCAKISHGSPMRMMLLLVAATAILSAFLDNVTTVLLVAPITLVVASELEVPALPYLMAETISSNIGGTATLIGDPPNLIIGSVAKLDFMAFIWNMTPVVIIIMILYMTFLYIHYHKHLQVTVEKRAKIMELNEMAAITDMDNLKRGGLVMIFTIIGFLIHGALDLQPSIVATTGATAALMVCKVDTDHAFEKVEWSTLFFFIGLFVLVSGADHANLTKTLGSVFNFTHDWNPLLTVLFVMWVSGISAAIINNVSFTAAMVSIVATYIADVPAFAGSVQNQHLMWWGLALAVCLGGNGTIVGAAANLVVAGIAEKSGIKITFRRFLNYSIPITMGSMGVASIYIIIRYFALCRV
ncbi:MAG: hypothetical protein A2017_04875 [Lentisphaerae bacterium GWF2_44_16]|nr:MAG: hypothetical protein A2017_04875 [Lentisphaerae bacterium GWF2_44_16]